MTQRVASRHTGLQLDNSWATVADSSPLPVEDLTNDKFILLLSNKLRSNASASPARSICGLIQRLTTFNEPRRANYPSEAGMEPVALTCGEAVATDQEPPPELTDEQQTIDRAVASAHVEAMRNRDPLACETSPMPEPLDADLAALLMARPAKQACHSFVTQQDYSDLVAILLRLPHAKCVNHDNFRTDTYWLRAALFCDLEFILCSLLFFRDTTHPSCCEVCPQCLDALNAAISVNRWRLKLYLLSLIEQQCKKGRLKTTSMLNFATTLFPFHVSPNTDASERILAELHQSILDLTATTHVDDSNYLLMWVKLSVRHQVCPRTDQADWLSLADEERLFLRKTYAWAAMRLSFSERQTLAREIVLNWERGTAVHAVPITMLAGKLLDLMDTLHRLEEGIGLTDRDNVLLCELLKELKRNQVAAFMLMREPSAWLTFIVTGGKELPLPLDNRMVTATLGDHGLYHLKVKKNWLNMAEIYVHQRENKRLRGLLSKLSDYYPPSCEVDYRFATTNPHSIATALLCAPMMLNGEQRERNNIQTEECLAHLVRCIESHTLGWSAWNWVATLLSTFDDTLGAKRRSYEFNSGLLDLPFDKYNQMAKEISVCVRAFNKLPDGTLLTPDECVASMGFETGLGRYTMHSDIANEVANRSTAARHLSTHLLSDGDFELPDDDNWGFLDHDPEHHAMMREELENVISVVLDRRVARTSLEHHLEQRQNWVAAGSASDGSVVVGGEKVRGNKRSWAEKFDSKDKAVELLNSTPKEMAVGSEKHEVDKARALYAPDADHYLISSYVTGGMEKRLHLVQGIEKGASGAEQLAREARRCWSTLTPDVFITCIDFADFNIQHTNIIMALFFAVVHDCAASVGAHPNYLAMCRWLERSQSHRYFNFLGAASKDHHVYPAKQGMFSGTRGTDILNTVLNLCYTKVSDRLLYRIFGIAADDLYSVHQGDDVFISNKSLTYSVGLVLVMKATGLRLQKTKQLFSRDKGEFLRVQYAQGKARGILHRALHNAILRPLQSLRLPDPSQNVPALYSNLAVLQRRGLSDAAATVWWWDQVNRYRRIMAGDRTTVAAIIPWEVVAYSGWLGGMNAPPPNCLPGKGPKLAPLPQFRLDVSLINKEHFPSGMSDNWVSYLSRVVEGHKLDARTLRNAALKGNYAAVLNAYNRDSAKRKLISGWNDWMRTNRTVINKLPKINQLEVAVDQPADVALASMRGLAVMFNSRETTVMEHIPEHLRVEIGMRVRSNIELYSMGVVPTIPAGILSQVHRAIASTQFKGLTNLLLAFDRSMDAAVAFVLQCLRDSGKQASAAYDALATIPTHQMHRILQGLSGITVFGCEHVTPLMNPNLAGVIANIASDITLEVCRDHDYLAADDIRFLAAQIGVEMLGEWTRCQHDLALMLTDIQY